MLQIVWKVSLQFGKIPDSLENFQTALKVFLTVWKVSGHSGIIADSLEHFFSKK